MYRDHIKRLLDLILSLGAAVVLAIPMGLLALWVKLDFAGAGVLPPAAGGGRKDPLQHPQIPDHAGGYAPRRTHPPT